MLQKLKVTGVRVAAFALDLVGFAIFALLLVGLGSVSR